MLCCPDSAPLDSIALDALLQLDYLIDSSRSFKGQLREPYTKVPANEAAYLCLLQGEAAALNASHLPGVLIGSQDATTCLNAIIWCPTTCHVWAAHIDQPLSSGDTAVLTQSLSQMQQPELYVAGAYCDHQNLGPSTAQRILQQLHSLQERISLRLLCVGAANTAADGQPCVCQLVLDTAAGTVHPWTFADRGPEVPRRCATQSCRYSESCRLLNIWDGEQQQLVLESFDPTVLGSWLVMRYEQMIGWPDEQLLQVMSTSPDCEPPWFCQDVRKNMRFLINAQEPVSAERAAAEQSTRYRWCSDAHTWKAVAADDAAEAALVVS